MVRAGVAVQAPERFARLTWSTTNGEFPHLKYGMLGGGLSDGTVCVWNPAQIIDSDNDASKTSLMCRLNKHQGSVRGLAFNPYSAKLLASGAADGELCIWDLGNPAQPSLYPAMKGAAAGSQNPITCLQWNSKVQHILATGSASGSVVVWDLKKQRPVITLSDTGGRRRCSSIAWNPEIATQIMVASDDDASASLQMWDLRNSVSPVMELWGHSKGVLSLDWSPHDTSMLLSSGKDNKVIVWDVPSGTPRRELPSGPNWKFEVQWSNAKQPSLFAGATFEGLVSIHSLAACPIAGQSEGQPSQVAASKPAEWQKKPVAGASFGFGGKLLKVVNTKRQMPTGETVTSASVEIDQLCVEGAVSSLSPEFEEVIRNADKDSLRKLCEVRSKSVQDPEEAETWKFLQTHFESDSKHQLLCRLGFEGVLPQEEAAAPEEEYIQQGMENVQIQESEQKMQSREAFAQQVLTDGTVDDGAAFFTQHSVDGASFFDNLGSPNQKPLVVPSQAAPPSEGILSPKSPKILAGVPGEAEGEIQKALFVGNYKGAVECSIEKKRFSDALIIASMIGGELWSDTMKNVMKLQPRPYMALIHATLSGDWMAFVKSRSPKDWRETLATLLTNAPYDQFEELVGALGTTLEHLGARHPSILCNICAGNVEAAVRQWSTAAGKNANAKIREVRPTSSPVIAAT